MAVASIVFDEHTKGKNIPVAAAWMSHSLMTFRAVSLVIAPLADCHQEGMPCVPKTNVATISTVPVSLLKVFFFLHPTMSLTW